MPVSAWNARSRLRRLALARRRRLSGESRAVPAVPPRRACPPDAVRHSSLGCLVGLTDSCAELLGEPELFFTTPGYDGFPLVMLRLAEVDLERLRELVTDAWRMRAPDLPVRDLDGGAG